MSENEWRRPEERESAPAMTTPAPLAPPRKRHPDYATWLLVAVLLASAAVGGASQDPATLRRLGARPALFGFHPRPDQLFLPLFLHFGWLHFACNLFSWMVIAGSLELVAGSAIILYLFVFTGVASIMVSLWHAPQAMALGCSGAIFGLWAARVLHSWWPPGEPDRYKITLLFTCGLGLTVLPQKAGLPVDTWGHLGGLVAGLVGYAAYRAGGVIRIGAMVALLALAGWVSRPPWLPVGP